MKIYSIREILKNSRQSYFEGLWYEIFWDMFLGQKWIIWNIFDIEWGFSGFLEAILDPYFAFSATLSQKLWISLKIIDSSFFPLGLWDDSNDLAGE